MDGFRGDEEKGDPKAKQAYLRYSDGSGESDDYLKVRDLQFGTSETEEASSECGDDKPIEK